MKQWHCNHLDMHIHCSIAFSDVTLMLNNW